MRTRTSGGVGRAVSNGGPYPIYAILASRNQFFVCLHGHFGKGF